MKDKKQKESLKYLGAISGLLAAYGADAQIKYVDLADTTLNTNNAYWDLDIDEDSLGVVDYRFIQYVDTSIFNVSGNFVQSRGVAANSIIGLDYGNYAYPFNLSPGDSIGPNSVYKGSGGSYSLGQLSMISNGTGSPNDKFNGALNGLIGVRFRAEVDDTLRNFYGWIRVDVAADYKSITIKDYGYNEQYGEGIVAGEGSNWIGLEEIEEQVFGLHQLDESLFFEILEGQAQLQIFSLGGALVWEQEYEKGQSRLDLQELKKGMYIARLHNRESSEEIRVLVY